MRDICGSFGGEALILKRRGNKVPLFPLNESFQDSVVKLFPHLLPQQFARDPGNEQFSLTNCSGGDVSYLTCT